MSGSSSMLSSLGAILHGRSSSSTIYPALHGHPLTDAFDNHLCQEISRLQAGGQYLTAAWLRQALETVLSGHSQVEDMIPRIQQTVLRQNSRWINDHLDDTVQLLDVCNALRETMSDIRQYTRTLQRVVHSLSGVSLGPGQLVRARTAMESFKGSFAKPKKTRKFGLEHCGSMLRRIGEKLLAAPPSGAGNPKEKPEFLEAIHACKAFTVFVCGVMVAALWIKARRSVAAPPCSGSWGWGCALQGLYDKVKDEMDKSRNKGGGGRPLLQELEAVETAARRLSELVHRSLNTKSVPLNDGQGRELREYVEWLKKYVAELEQGMVPLERLINELFRVLVTSRMALLNSLSYL